jgi:hypothetical protein
VEPVGVVPLWVFADWDLIEIHIPHQMGRNMRRNPQGRIKFGLI